MKNTSIIIIKSLLITLFFLNTITAQTVLFEDDFETGVFKSEWIQNPNLEGINGIVNINSGWGVDLTYAAAIGKSSDVGGFTRNALDLKLDLSGKSYVFLSFDMREHYDETHPQDGLF